MNESRIIRRAFCRFAAIALALMSTVAFAAPALAYADDSVNVTVNVTATTESGEKVSAEEALLQVNAVDGEDLSIEGTPYRNTVSYETSNPVVSGQATYFSVIADCGRLCYLNEIVLTDNTTGEKVVFSCPEGEDHVGGSFGGTSMVETRKFGNTEVCIWRAGVLEGKRVNLLFMLRNMYGGVNTSGSFTITYNYIPADQHVLTFLAEDGRELATFERWNNTGAPEEYEMPAAPEKAGATFEGWFTDEGEQFVPGMLVTSSKTYRARYSTPGASTVRIEYDLQGGSIDGASSLPAQSIGRDDTIPLPGRAPVRDGYTFAGWTINGTAVKGGALASDFLSLDGSDTIVLVASWSPVQPDSEEPSTDSENDADPETEDPAETADKLPATGDSALTAIAACVGSAVLLISGGVACAHRGRGDRGHS